MKAVAIASDNRLEAVDWAGVEASLDEQGFAKLPVVLDPAECDTLACTYVQDAPFRSRIDMARYRFGSGEYKYFAAPLPPVVQSLRENLYARLAPTANRWKVRLKPDATDAYPAALPDFLARCHEAGQTRPTPLLLSYVAGDYNCLHQDIYGALAFPLQVVFALSRAGEDYQGGELLLVEQRPRAQSRGHAVRIEQGAGVIFATRERPTAGSRGDYRVNMRHGVSTVTEGARMTLGIIFHDAT
ncbi:MAG TPA: 2OG-Fe(II) oxygenase [Vicinamibacterales bacterium]|nr:2OG-Fe(II) oxygenase [Vicinamibacterales bacterium]